MHVDVASREEYFSAAGAREGDLRVLDALIQESAPGLEPTLSGDMGSVMLGYGEQPYRTRSMKEPATWPVVALAVQKRHLSLYVCAVVDGRYVAEAYADRLGSVDCGKSCIRFTRLEKLDLEGLRAMLGEVNERFTAGERLYGA